MLKKYVSSIPIWFTLQIDGQPPSHAYEGSQKNKTDENPLYIYNLNNQNSFSP